MIKYEQGKKNATVDVLSRRYVLVNTLASKIMGFESLSGLYYIDLDFKETFENINQEKRVGMFQMVDTIFLKNGEERFMPMSAWR